MAPLFGLAPGGVCRADAVTRAAGELLPHRFTLTVLALASRRDGGLLSVALSVGSPPLAVSQHPALRSPDFPPIAQAQSATARPSLAPDQYTAGGRAPPTCRSGPAADVPKWTRRRRAEADNTVSKDTGRIGMRHAGAWAVGEDAPATRRSSIRACRPASSTTPATDRRQPVTRTGILSPTASEATPMSHGEAASPSK